MNAFEKVLNLTAAEKRRQGVEFTPPEIAQQPAAWAATAAAISERRHEIAPFLVRAGLLGDEEAAVILTGAGSSEFIGTSVAPALRRHLRREVQSIATTHLVTHMASTFVPGHRYAVVSFTRSGNSPESLATFQLAKRAAPPVRQIVITCSRTGAMAVAARKDAHSLCIELPEMTNDQSLAMTSSFTSMALAGIGLGYLDAPGALADLAARAGDAARRVIAEYGDTLQRTAALPFQRACFLGSGALFGTMQECHLKMQELTAGRVACRFDTCLGLRHGPQVFVNADCLIVASLASDPNVRRYEMDMLQELSRKQQGCGILAVCDRATDDLRRISSAVVELFPEGKPIADDHRVLTDVVVGQILATFKSMHLGLKPDNPSPDGTINRVVQGVTIYDP